MKKQTYMWAGLGCGGFVLLYLILMVAILVGDSGDSIAGSKSVGVIRLNGAISGSSDSAFGNTAITPESVIDQIDKAEDDENIKAVLIRIDSPGGSAAASEEIFEAVKAMKKPTIVSVSDICASGSYWVASAADAIYANRSSAVGSIGVVMEIPNLEGLYKKLGIKNTYIYKGKYKITGAPDRPLKEEERKLLDAEAEEVYRIFIKSVAEARDIPEKRMETLATGQTWNGETARRLNLIDEIGNYKKALDAAARAGGLKPEEYKTVELGEVDPWQWLSALSADARSLGGLARLLQSGDGIRF